MVKLFQIIILLIWVTNLNAQFFDLSSKDNAATLPFDKRVIEISKHAFIQANGSTLPDSSIIITKGFYSIGDGGGSRYLILRSIPSGLTLDSVSVIPITGTPIKYAVLTPESNEVSFKSFGIIAGDIETDNATYPTFSEKKEAWKDNSKKIYRFYDYCIATGRTALYNTSLVQYYPMGEWETFFNEDESLVIKGLGRRETIIDQKPEHATDEIYDASNLNVDGRIEAIHYDDGVDLTLQDITFKGMKYEWKWQAYSAKLKPGGVANQLQITEPDSNIWSQFWSTLYIGKPIGYQLNSTDEDATESTVSAFDSTTGLITLADNLGVHISSDDSTATSFAMLRFDEQLIEDDTIDRYADNIFYFTSGSGQANIFIDAVLSQPVFEKQGNIKFKNVRIAHFGNAVSRTGGWINFDWDDIVIDSVFSVGFSSFIGSYENPSVGRINKLELSYCGTLVTGNINPPYITSGNIWGSGAYTHVNMNWDILNSYIHDNTAGAFRQYSASGTKTAAETNRSRFYKCVFARNGEYSLLSASSIPTYLDYCKFLEYGNVRLGERTAVTNSEFEVSIEYSGGTNPYPPNNSSDPIYSQSFDNCVFRNMSISLNWPNDDQINKLRLNISNSEIQLGKVGDLKSAFISGNTGNEKYITANIKDCLLGISDTITAISDINTPATVTGSDSIRAFLSVYEGMKVRIENLRFQSTRQDTLGRENQLPVYYGNMFSSSSGTDFNYDVNVFDSDIIWASLAERTQRPEPENINLYRCNFAVQGTFEDNTHANSVAPIQIREFQHKTKYSVLPTSGQFEIDWNYNKYLLDTDSQDTIKILTMLTNDFAQGRTDINANHLSDAEFTIHPLQDMWIQTNSGNSSTYLIGSTDIVFLPKNQPVKINGNGTLLPISTDTVQIKPLILYGTGDGSTTSFSDLAGGYDEYLDSIAMPSTGTFKVGQSGVYSIELNLGDHGQFSNGDVRGIIPLGKTGHLIEFETAPTTGDSIFVEGSKYYPSYSKLGSWSIVSGRPKDFTSGLLTPTTDLSGQFTVTHGLGETPAHLSIGNLSGTEYNFEYSCGSTSCTVTVYDGTGTDTTVNSTGLNVSWAAFR